MGNERKYETFKVTKPKNDGNGTTVQLQRGSVEAGRCVFMTFAKQKSDTTVQDAKFDYDNKVIVKLGHMDIGAMISVLSLRAPSLGEKGLYHQFKDTKTSIKMKKNDPKYGGFFLEVNKTSGENVRSGGGIPITEYEAIPMKLLLESCIPWMYGWEIVSNGVDND